MTSFFGGKGVTLCSLYPTRLFPSRCFEQLPEHRTHDVPPALHCIVSSISMSSPLPAQMAQFWPIFEGRFQKKDFDFHFLEPDHVTQKYLPYICWSQKKNWPKMFLDQHFLVPNLFFYPNFLDLFFFWQKQQQQYLKPQPQL